MSSNMCLNKRKGNSLTWWERVKIIIMLQGVDLALTLQLAGTVLFLDMFLTSNVKWLNHVARRIKVGLKSFKMMWKWIGLPRWTLRVLKPVGCTGFYLRASKGDWTQMHNIFIFNLCTKNLWKYLSFFCPSTVIHYFALSVSEVWIHLPELNPFSLYLHVSLLCELELEKSSVFLLLNKPYSHREKPPINPGIDSQYILLVWEIKNLHQLSRLEWVFQII